MARTVGSAAEDTRQRIIDTATELFTERGYAGTSVRDIAERLGMTKGSLYYHFSSKEDLLYALMSPLIDALAGFIAAAQGAGSVSADVVCGLVDLLDAHAAMLRSLTTDPAVARAKLDVLSRFNELERVLSGSMDAAAVLRGRCALGLIIGGVLGPPRHGHCGVDAMGDREPSRRLTEEEKAFVTAAAIAVLAVPTPAPGLLQRLE